jgi:hypothetical protein
MASKEGFCPQSGNKPCAKADEKSSGVSNLASVSEDVVCR